ncbi:MAG TPA: hypothetical protein VFF30_18350 [Nitrososphaerales archaeon]|nr:hypothetical protein [Nitrososphaerales archaeon]
MSTKVSAGRKKILDFVLAICGFALGLATNTGIVGPTVGLAGGYLVSDLIAEVDNGTVSTDTLTQQIEAVLPKVMESVAQQKSSNSSNAQPATITASAKQ